MLLQEDLHLDGSSILHNGGTSHTGRYGTRGHTDDKVEHKIGKPHRHGECIFDREGTLRQIYQRVWVLQNEAICERVSTVLQLTPCRTFRMEIQTCTYCAGRHHSLQCKDNKQLPLKCANCGKEHATTSRLCPNRMEAEKKEKTAPAAQRTTHKQDSGKPAPIPQTHGPHLPYMKWRNGPFHAIHKFP